MAERFQGFCDLMTANRNRAPLTIPSRRAAASLPGALCLLLSLVGTSLAVQVAIAASPSTEYKVKAAMVYKLLKFIRWANEEEAGKDPKMNICIIGDDPFGEAIDAVAGRKVRDFEVAITRIERIDEIQGQCQVLFVSPAMEERLSPTLEASRKLPLLTIGDVEAFAEEGGIIELTKVRQRIGFEVNLSCAEENGIQISSQLLGMAEEVHYTVCKAAEGKDETKLSESRDD
jgi:hypothetical protein